MTTPMSAPETAPSAQPSLALDVLEGPARGARISLHDGGLRLGRGEVSLAGYPTDPEISRKHAIISCAPDGKYEIADLGSANGTFVNGTRAEGRVALEVGDVILVGRTLFHVVEDTGAPTELIAGASQSPPRHPGIAQDQQVPPTASQSGPEDSTDRPGAPKPKPDPPGYSEALARYRPAMWLARSNSSGYATRAIKAISAPCTGSACATRALETVIKRGAGCLLPSRSTPNIQAWCRRSLHSVAHKRPQLGSPLQLARPELPPGPRRRGRPTVPGGSHHWPTNLTATRPSTLITFPGSFSCAATGASSLTKGCSSDCLPSSRRSWRQRIALQYPHRVPRPWQLALASRNCWSYHSSWRSFASLELSSAKLSRTTKCTNAESTSPAASSSESAN